MAKIDLPPDGKTAPDPPKERVGSGLRRARQARRPNRDLFSETMAGATGDNLLNDVRMDVRDDARTGALR